jgi:hypothetical protein
MSIPALNAGLQGIHTGMNNLRRDAFEIAQSVHLDADKPAAIADSLVNLKLDELQVHASTKVVKTVDDLLGHLLDERA